VKHSEILPHIISKVQRDAKIKPEVELFEGSALSFYLLFEILLSTEAGFCD
jgi:hypothetical protein